MKCKLIYHKSTLKPIHWVLNADSLPCIPLMIEIYQYYLALFIKKMFVKSGRDFVLSKEELDEKAEVSRRRSSIENWKWAWRN